MLNRMSNGMIGSILLVGALMLFTTVPAGAAATCGDITGDYLVAGNLKISGSVTGFVSASITLPKLENLEEIFHFNPDGTLSDDLLTGFLGLAFFATWEQAPGACTYLVDFTDMAQSVLATLLESGIEAEIAGPTVVTGKISSKDGSLSGKANIKINLLSPLTGGLSVAMTFKGFPVDALEAKVTKSQVPGLKSFLSNLLSNLRKQGPPFGK